MSKLLSIVEDLELGDGLAWIASRAIDGTGETVHPNTVTRIDRREDSIRVYGEGIKGGQFHFLVYRDGESEAYFHNPNKDEPEKMGEVVAAMRTDSPVGVKQAQANLQEDC